MWFNKIKESLDNKQENIATNFQDILIKANETEKMFKNVCEVKERFGTEIQVLKNIRYDLEAKIICLKRQNKKLNAKVKNCVDIRSMQDHLKNDDVLTDNELKLWKIIYNKAYKKGYMDGYEKRIEDGWEDIEDDE